MPSPADSSPPTAPTSAPDAASHAASISHYIKEIGRGKDGARSLSREQAADLMGLVLDGRVTDLEVGGFCLAMRIKGETREEMAGFLDATHVRLQRVPAASGPPVIVIPSYNGARKLPLLTPLLALLLAREGLPVLIHGVATESTRLYTSNVLIALMERRHTAIKMVASSVPDELPQGIAPGQVAFVPTRLLHSGLQRLLDVRRVVGLRNPAHSLVKQMNPCVGAAVVISSYTHPEYALSMAATFTLTGATALLLRGTEGESVADARRTPHMDAFLHGESSRVQEAQSGALAVLPDWPAMPNGPDAQLTAAYIHRVLEGESPVPAPLATQVEHILRMVQAP